jgi:hypothetical protein
MSMTASAFSQVSELPAAFVPGLLTLSRGVPASQPRTGADNIVWGTLSGADPIAVNVDKEEVCWTALVTATACARRRVTSPRR